MLKWPSAHELRVVTSEFSTAPDHRMSTWRACWVQRYLVALSRRIARPLLASIFIAGGLDALRNPGGKVKAAEAVVSPISESVSSIPTDPETLVRLNGAVQVVSGSLLAVGRFRRL